MTTTRASAIARRPASTWTRVAAAAALVLALLATSCLDPKDRRPGLRLGGEVVTTSVDDWSFTDGHAEIYIQVATPYLLPHSVTIVCASLDGELYVGARHPSTKRWVSYVARDPNVRLKIGTRVYERRLETVDDAAQHEVIFRAYAAKYGWDVVPPEERPPLQLFRVIERA